MTTPVTPIVWKTKVVVAWSDGRISVWDTNDGYADTIAHVIETDLGTPKHHQRSSA